MMRFAALGSGSRGNALIVESGQTRVMLDCGFGSRETVRRLTRLDLTPEDLAGIVVTHEHSDHVAGVFKFAARYKIKVWMTHGTFSAAPRGLGALPEINLIGNHQPFPIGDLQLHPFPVPHDAREPAQFTFADGQRRLGVLTDVGSSTPHIEAMLSGCDALVLECNHDAQMLAQGNYPPSLKQRVSGRFGHLDNAAAAVLLAALDNSRLQHIVAAHLSQHNNSPALARRALAPVLGCAEDWIGIADQEAGFAWRELV